MTQSLPDFRRGDTVKIRVQYPSGTDLTGYRFWLTLKKAFEDADPDAVLQVRTTSGDHEDDRAEDGLVYLVVPAEPSAQIPPGKYYWDIQATAPDGETRTLAPPVGDYKQRVTVVPDVTVTPA